MINILSHHLGVQGSNLNMLDLNDYLINELKTEVIYYTNSIEDTYNTIHKSKRNYKFYLLDSLENYVQDINSTVLTDFKTLIMLYKKNISIKCKSLIIFDNNELSYHLNDSKQAKFYHDNIDINKIMAEHTFTKHLFLMPKSNIKIFNKKYPELKNKEYYKRISFNRLQDIKPRNNHILWYRFDDIDIKNEMVEKYGSDIKTMPEYEETELWDYKGLVYYRRKHLDYYEQFGRLVFEFILLNKEVHFLKDPFEIQDGLSDYLKYYCIKFDKNFKVQTTADELTNKMKQNTLSEILNGL